MNGRGRISKKRDYEGAGFVSRDHALIVQCMRTSCPVNSSNHCSMPSVIKINAAGACIKGQEFAEKPAVKPSRTVCKWCGGEIREVPGGFGHKLPRLWEHVEEKMSHLAQP